jgi:hypothetical protein
MTTEQLFKKWQLFAPLGLTLIGFGLSVVGHAVGLKTTEAVWWQWVVWGTLGLVLTNAGIAVFGDAVKCRVLYELRDGKS